MSWKEEVKEDEERQKCSWCARVCIFRSDYLSLVILHFSVIFSLHPNCKIADPFTRSQIHLKDRKFISKIANSFPRLQIHFKDWKFISKIANPFTRSKFICMIANFCTRSQCITKIANAFSRLQMLLLMCKCVCKFANEF